MVSYIDGQDSWQLIKTDWLLTYLQIHTWDNNIMLYIAIIMQTTTSIGSWLFSIMEMALG